MRWGDLTWIIINMPLSMSISVGKRIHLQCRRCRFDPWVRKIPWRRAWQLTPVFLPGESHGQRSPVGHSPYGHKESDGHDWSNIAHRHTIWTKRIERCLLLRRKAVTNLDRGGGRWDSEMTSPTQWTWIWAELGRQRRTQKPGKLRSMGSQRIRHDRATEQQ